MLVKLTTGILAGRIQNNASVKINNPGLGLIDKRRRFIRGLLLCGWKNEL
jgi:hypothetical protein